MIQKYTNKITIFINYLIMLYMFLLPFNISFSNKLFTLIFILFLFSGDLKEKLLYALKHKVVQSLFMFYAMYFFWSYHVEHVDIVFWKLKEFKYLFDIIIFITIIKDTFKEKILNAFILSVLISVVVSICMKLQINISFITITGYGQLTPFFYTYSQYVLLIIITANILLYRMIQNNFHTFIYKFLNYSFFILTTILIFMLDSKLGYFLYFLSITFLIIYSFKKISKKKVLFSLILIFTIGYITAFEISSTFHSRVTNLYNQTINVFLHDKYIGSTGERLAWNIIGFKFFLNKPFLGYGTQKHIDLVINYVNKSSLTQSEKNALLKFKNPATPWMQTLHNEYLDHLIQFGIVGLLLLLNIFYSIYKEPSSHKELQILRYILLIVFMLYLFVNYFFVLSQLGKIFFLLVSLTLVSYEDYKTKRERIL